MERGPHGPVLHVMGVDGISFSLGLLTVADRSAGERGTMDDTRLRQMSYFFTPSYADSMCPYPTPRLAMLCPIPAAVLADDTDSLRALHVATKFEARRGAGLDSIGAPMLHPVADPGYGCLARVWRFSSPLDWEHGDGPLRSDVVRGAFVSRLLEEGGDEVPGLAHQWLRFLPPWFVHRMACVCMAWADAVDVLSVRRMELDDACATYLADSRAAAQRAATPHGRPPPAADAAAGTARARILAADTARAAAHAEELEALEARVDDLEEDILEGGVLHGPCDVLMHG